MTGIAERAVALAESGKIPDSVIRAGMRGLISQRRRQVRKLNGGDVNAFVEMMDASPIALVPDRANEQHYEVPAEFFAQVLGRHRKYSSCFWSEGAETLDDAEEAALEVTCRRAAIKDGQQVLDLGCGWGSLSLWIAGHCPNSFVTSVSNSASQCTFIEQQAERLGLDNIRVITADMNEFSCEKNFDRIVSVEMFEHMRNYRAMYQKIAALLKEDGYFFMHIFCHRDAPYEFVDAGPADWMSRHFFSGGIMPSADLPFHFQDNLKIIHRWSWSGQEYCRTAAAWLANMDRRKHTIMPILAGVYGSNDAAIWWMRWRMFFLAVSELFAAESGAEWHIGHYLFQRRRA
jgi:cyclopropane-fatty-acyl-phospholipid synthase